MGPDIIKKEVNVKKATRYLPALALVAVSSSAFADTAADMQTLQTSVTGIIDSVTPVILAIIGSALGITAIFYGARLAVRALKSIGK